MFYILIIIVILSRSKIIIFLKKNALFVDNMGTPILNVCWKLPGL